MGQERKAGVVSGSGGTGMITISLDEHSAENMKAIQALRKMGIGDKEIQKLVDRQAEIDKHISGKDNK